MKETAFIKRNKPRWDEFELLLKTERVHPDIMADLFIKVTDDLAYSRTYYPESRTTKYLNWLAAGLHQSIYKNKKESSNRLITFWTLELPLMFKSAHKELLLSFLIFTLFVIIGAVSTHYDNDFPRIILGDSYVNMTLENIKSGDPMAVYKKMDGTDMFFRITLNNIMVSFYTFAAGIFSSLGTAYYLLRNGIMLGAFQYFFHQHGLLLETFLVIWIHGTLEISAIVIAGAAGMVMGNSILFPQTYSRMQSFMMGAKRGVKIIVGLVPIFIMAGFLESFVTRLTEMHDILKLAIILTSLTFIIGYFVIYPIILNRKLSYNPEQETNSIYANYEN
jgi:uncharacterized membrane protein SpoIIM required for sporulation